VRAGGGRWKKRGERTKENRANEETKLWETNEANWRRKEKSQPQI
jgi:hypothetical protein